MCQYTERVVISTDCDMKYERFLDSTAANILSAVEEKNGVPFFLTVTFAPTKVSVCDDQISVVASTNRSVVSSFEDCYFRLLNSKKFLGKHIGPETGLTPFTYGFQDFRIFRSRQSVYAIMVVHSGIVDNLETLGTKGLKKIFRKACPDVAAVDLERIDTLYERVAVNKESGIRRVVTTCTDLDPASECLERKGALPYACSMMKFYAHELGREDFWTVSS